MAYLYGVMQIPDERLREIQRLYRETKGKEVTLDEARGMAQRLLTIFKVILRPLPDDEPASSSSRSPGQTEQ